MKFVSTRNPRDSVDFARALFHGLAPDGGLYRPECMPDLSDVFTGLRHDSSFRDIAAQTASGLLSPEIPHAALDDIVSDAFGFEPRLREIREDMMVMELFHGPSCAFKDFGASFLASAMNRLLALGDRRAVIITATSGDTGSAVARAFFGKPRIDVVILYPSGRVSPLQEKQLTTLGGNVTALEVRAASMTASGWPRRPSPPENSRASPSVRRIPSISGGLSPSHSTTSGPGWRCAGEG